MLFKPPTAIYLPKRYIYMCDERNFKIALENQLFQGPKDLDELKPLFLKSTKMRHESKESKKCGFLFLKKSA